YRDRITFRQVEEDALRATGIDAECLVAERAVRRRSAEKLVSFLLKRFERVLDTFDAPADMPDPGTAFFEHPSKTSRWRTLNQSFAAVVSHRFEEIDKRFTDTVEQRFVSEFRLILGPFRLHAKIGFQVFRDFLDAFDDICHMVDLGQHE